MNKKLMMGVGIIGIIAIVLLIGFNLRKDNQEELDINSALVQELYEMANPSNDALVLKELYANNVITDKFKITMGIVKYLKDNPDIAKQFRETSDEDQKYLSKEIVLDNARKVLGEQTVYRDQDVYVLNGDICNALYHQDSEQYEIISGCDGNQFESFYRKITKAYQENNTIYIYEKSIYVYDDWDDYVSKKSIYNNYNKEKLLDYIETDSSENYKILVEDYIDEAATYRYKYVLENGEYVFEGLELV